MMPAAVSGGAHGMLNTHVWFKLAEPLVAPGKSDRAGDQRSPAR